MTRMPLELTNRLPSTWLLLSWTVMVYERTKVLPTQRLLSPCRLVKFLESCIVLKRIVLLDDLTEMVSLPLLQRSNRLYSTSAFTGVLVSRIDMPIWIAALAFLPPVTPSRR